ncbi:PR domain-containing protein 11-like [Mercenaria mercenaria]|uniref:PR domain-containing protein 11-like n=1 Tax=Mercenaria mercenaria TaxID=6596 RepID=UPI00234F92EF|nr:PR domain-containing protein 11-like [Mercenaria mercenaria]
MRLILVFWIYIYSHNYTTCFKDYSGTDIGYNCKFDAECTAGNGGEYSKCNQDLNICICTINHLGEDKCMQDSDKYDGVCRYETLYNKKGFCTLECSPKGTTKWQESQDWYGEIVQPFASIIPDKKTPACYDPRRAFNSIPDGFEIKSSTLPEAGLGVFTNIYIERNTVFGPFKGTFDQEEETAVASGYSWMIQPRDGEDRADIVWIDAKDVSLSNWLRYFNTPTTIAMENVVAFQFKGEMFYQVFKSIQPGTEMLIWYGENYGDYLKIEEFEPPRYYFSYRKYIDSESTVLFLIIQM